MALEQVSTFVLPNEYQRQATEARRRRRMAEMLAQQAYQPSDISAPIPTAAPLVQGLQAFLAARAERKADEAEEAAKGTASREARQYLKALTEAPDMTTDAVQPETKPTATVTMPQFEGDRLTSPAGIEMGAPAPMVAPQIQLSRYNLTPGQRRAAALEGMLTSENPMVQKIAGAIYPTLTPPKPEIGAVSPADFTPESLREYQRTGDFGVLRQKEQAPSTAGLSSLSKMLSEREARIARNPNDPNIAILSDAIKKEIAPARGTTVNVTNRYGAPIPAVDAQGNPVFIQPSQTGGAPSVVSGYKPPAKDAEPTVNEQTALYNTARIVNAAKEIKDVVSRNPSAVKPSAKEALTEMFIPSAAGSVRNAPRQIVVGAQADMLDSLITMATGAAYTAEQKEAAKESYIPAYTDKPETIAAKRQRLLNLIPIAKQRSGRAWNSEIEQKMREAINSVAPAQTGNQEGFATLPSGFRKVQK